MGKPGFPHIKSDYIKIYTLILYINEFVEYIYTLS